jgi:hypothetical protein
MIQLAIGSTVRMWVVLPTFRRYMLSPASRTTSLTLTPVDPRQIYVPIILSYIFHLGHYATSRKVAGSIPDEVIGFFN